jgi:type II secretory pathway component GspD/PulD (secretin)
LPAPARGTLFGQSAAGYTLSVENEFLDVVLQQVASQNGTPIRIIGDAHQIISYQGSSRLLPHLLTELCEAQDHLLLCSQGSFTLYARGAEAQLDGSLVLFPYHLRNLSSGEAFEAIQQFVPEEQANLREFSERNCILIHAPLSEVRLVVDYLRTLDQPRQMVAVELLVIEYFHQQDFSWSFDLSSGTLGPISGGQINTQPGQGNLGISYEFLSNLDPSFKLNIQALAGKNYARVVTNPHLVVQSGDTANVENLESRIVQLLATSDFALTTTLQTVEAGVHLTVLPEVSGDSLVNLSIYGLLSNFIPNPQGEPSTLFFTETNEVHTQVDVHSGQTLIIGGIIREEEDWGKSGIPGLHNIPLVGWIFARKSTLRMYSETVIYVTPYLEPFPSYSTLRSTRRETEELEGAIPENRLSPAGRRQRRRPTR